MKYLLNILIKVLCVGFVFISCTEDLPIADEENENGAATGPAHITTGQITATTISFSGFLDMAEADEGLSEITVYYSESDSFIDMDERMSRASTTDFDQNGFFRIKLTDLRYNTEYKYRIIVKVGEDVYSEGVKTFTTENVSLDLVSVVTQGASAQLSGTVTGLSSEDLPHISFGVLYSLYKDEVGNEEGTQVFATLGKGNTVSLTLSPLNFDSTYYYCSFINQDGRYVYGDIKDFRVIHPYDQKPDYNLEMSSATDLSSSSSANCYIISSSDVYKFKTVKGNSGESVGDVAFASILWETFGTSTAPTPCDLIKSLCYQDSYIVFQTADTFTEGNAVIAAKDANGTILWSWHIWFTDQPEEQVYFNNAGTMMDRNLGATSATPGDVGALGLLYQWGRKDPFLGASSISSSMIAASTITWPADSYAATIEYAVAHPTTFITGNSDNYDWCVADSSPIDNTRWTTSEVSKSIYDPCPAGWRVPDGGYDGVWQNAWGISSYATEDASLFDTTNLGMNFFGVFGLDATIWYPSSGFLESSYGWLQGVGSECYCWSASPGSIYAYRSSYNAFNFHYKYYGYICHSYDDNRSYGCSVRCVQE
jgi:hypothetical protein